MGRIRTIKPEFFTDEDLSKLPEVTHYGMAAGLLTYADDEGYFTANPGLIEAAPFPLRESSVSTHDMLTQLENMGYIRRGSTPDGKVWGVVVNFTKHQRVNRPTSSKIKTLPIRWEPSVTTHGGLTEDSLPERKGTGKGREGNMSTCARDDEREHAMFLLVQSEYPANPARADWIGAERAARRLVEDGAATWQILADGVARYSRHCSATNRLVMNPVKFFTDHDKPWSQPWPVPPTKAQAAQSANIDASLQWLDRSKANA